MNKSEFINEMRLSLTGKMDTSSINDNLRYYEDYINAEVRKGNTEEEVITSLGDANALAINLIDAAERNATTNSNSSDNKSDESPNEQAAKKPFWLNAISFFISHPVLTICIIIGLILLLIILGIWLAVSILTHLWPIILILILAVIIGGLVYGLIKFINKK